jgi:FkbM family methyltransferase
MSSSLKHWVTKYKIKSNGIIHAGAHLVQERELYKELNLEPVLWIEAHPDIANEARKLLEIYPKQRLVNAALWSESDLEITLSEAGNEGSSSSLLELGLITGSHPQVVCTRRISVRTRTLEEVLSAEEDFARSINFLSVDTQGAEAEVIRGLGKRISGFDFVLAEVSIRRLYKSAVLFHELTELLSENEFELIASNVNHNTGWGEALYVRLSVVQKLNLTQGDFEHVRIKQGTGFATKIRYLLLAIGIPNRIVAKFSRNS